MYKYEQLKKEYETKKDRESLIAVRNFLDKHGYKMPDPKYEYHPRNKSTWKYTGGIIRYDQKTGEVNGYQDIINTDFSYK